MESKIADVLEKIVEFEPLFYSKIYTKRVQQWLIVLPISFILASIAYQFLNYPTDQFVLIIMATSLFFMFQPFLSLRKRPFLLFSCTFSTFAAYTLIYFTHATIGDPRFFQILYLGGFSLSSCSLYPMDQCTMRSHFTDIFPLSYIISGKRRQTGRAEFVPALFLLATLIYFYLYKNAMSRANFVLTVPDILGLIGMCLMLCAFVVGEILHAQKQTRLRFDPTSENDKYTKTPYNTTSRELGYIRIIKSSTYEITLENIGDREWYSGVKEHGIFIPYCLTRKPQKSSKKYSYAFRRRLPSFCLKPMETVVLVPEYHEFDGPCERIKGLYCFNIKDISEEVETCLVSYLAESKHPPFAKRVDFYEKLEEIV